MAHHFNTRPCKECGRQTVCYYRCINCAMRIHNKIVKSHRYKARNMERVVLEALTE